MHNTMTTEAAPDVELGPVCESCLRYLPYAHLSTSDPRVLCDDCRKAGL